MGTNFHGILCNAIAKSHNSSKRKIVKYLFHFDSGACEERRFYKHLHEGVFYGKLYKR